MKTCQVLMKAGASYGPDVMLHAGDSVAEHYKERLKGFLEFYHLLIRDGLVCELAHLSFYGARTVGCIYEIQDLTDDAELKWTARNFLDVYWATFGKRQ